MRQKILNPKTGQYEWVDMGPSASGNGCSDFHRHQRIVSIRQENFVKSCERIEKRTENMSEYRKQRYLRQIKIEQAKVKDLNELRQRFPKRKLLKTQRFGHHKIPGGEVESVYEEKYLGIKKEKPAKKYIEKAIETEKDFYKKFDWRTE